MDIVRCAVYIRVSTDEQAKEGDSLEAQEERLRDIAESNSWSVYKIYSDEGYSAKNKNRPALKKLLLDAKLKKFDVILVYKIDRLSRSLKDLIEIISDLNKYKIGFKSATELIDTTTPEGRLIFHQFGSFAQYERELISQRTKMGMMKRLRQGYWNTTPPFGYKLIDGKLEIDKKEADVVKLIFNLYVNKNMGVKNISTLLNEKNIKPRKSNKWRGNRIYNILTNPIYIGIVRWGGDEAEGIHTPIITKNTFSLVQERLKSKKNDTRRYRSPNYLTGLVKCDLCNSSMFITYPGSKEDYKYYVCSKRFNTKECKQDYIRVDILENSVINEIKKFAGKKNLIQKLIDEYLSHSREKIKELEQKKKFILEQIENLKKEKENLVNTILYKNPDKNMMKILNEKSDKIVNEENRLQKEIWRIEDKIQGLQNKNYGVKGISDYLKHFTMVFDELDYGERKLIIESIIEEVRIGKNKRVRFTLIPPYNRFGVSDPFCVPEGINNRKNLILYLKYNLNIYYKNLIRKAFLSAPFSKMEVVI